MLFAKIKQLVFSNKYLLAIIAIYLLTRLINLTLLPVFNDEAIYLDWGWRETHSPNILFYSLYDAKEPLLMWFFGLAESIFVDPLFAGRLVSVACGLLSLIGMYQLGKELWNKSTGLMASLLYATSPLFLFYDRQALMESALATVGIWACFLFVKMYHKPFVQYACLLGVVLGIGFFIKSTGIIFILSSLIMFCVLLIKEERKDQIISLIIFTFLTIFIILIPLFAQQQFWNTLSSTSRFSLTLSDYLQFPISIWWNNVLVLVGTSFFFLTPLVSVGSVMGTFKLFRKPQPQELLLILWVICTIFLQVLATRNSIVRYIVSFLPLLLLFASWYIMHLPKNYRLVSLILVLLFPLVMSLWQIFSPVSYIFSLGKMTSLAPIEYVASATSGYGISEIKKFIDDQSLQSRIIVGVAENTGNPESALEMYYQNSNSVTVVYMEKKLFGDTLDQYDCINPGHPLYFISREEQLAGLERLLVKVKTIKNPYGSNTLGIYMLNPNCKGKTANLQMIK